ncbi:MAG: RimK family alpha-L-glutamate ligase [Archangiaceae bacterium]|nr:RimK family alpha-L-glutamate ligase [Archangiaceae bacterium]
MRLTVLSRSAAVPSTARLVREARARGHKVAVMNPVKIELSFDRAGQELFSEAKRVVVPDVLVPRLAGSVAPYGLAVVEQFAMRGAIVMNDARAIARSRNPMRYLQVLAANGLEIPPTRLVHEARDLIRLSKSVGGYPLMVKILRGTEKHGTMVCETKKSLQAALEAVLGLGHDLVLQQFLKGGRNVRVLVLGNKAVAAFEKKKAKKKGVAKLTAALLSPTVARLAERAARAVSLELCTVDLLEGSSGAHVLEMNATPALPELEKASRQNLARLVVERAEELYEASRLKAASDKE